MKYGLDIATGSDFCDPRALADLAAEAEQAGWDGFFVWDVLFEEGTMDAPIADPWVTLSAVAVATRRIRIGAFMTPLARRRPWMVARETATLDHLSNGRLIFGAGLGYQALEFAPFGEETDPKIRAEKFDEGLTIVSGLWSGEPFSFAGKHYQIDKVTLLPRPVQQPRIPVWIAGYWPNRKPFRRAARWDGLYVGTYTTDGRLLTPEDFREMVAYVKKHRAGSEPFEVAVSGVTPLDREKGAEIVRPYADAGATWWIELSEETLAEMRERVRSGPPRIEA
jgi:alkanesulfonate monooxygenase SsuD/methylene tetrahydromethanopterin reductase-like flavin-dependent oxidoreductase (luciferase family)